MAAATGTDTKSSVAIAAEADIAAAKHRVESLKAAEKALAAAAAASGSSDTQKGSGSGSRGRGGRGGRGAGGGGRGRGRGRPAKDSGAGNDDGDDDDDNDGSAATDGTSSDRGRGGGRRGRRRGAKSDKTAWEKSSDDKDEEEDKEIVGVVYSFKVSGADHTVTIDSLLQTAHDPYGIDEAARVTMTADNGDLKFSGTKKGGKSSDSKDAVATDEFDLKSDASDRKANSIVGPVSKAILAGEKIESSVSGAIGKAAAGGPKSKAQKDAEDAAAKNIEDVTKPAGGLGPWLKKQLESGNYNDEEVNKSIRSTIDMRLGTHEVLLLDGPSEERSVKLPVKVQFRDIDRKTDKIYRPGEDRLVMPISQSDLERSLMPIADRANIHPASMALRARRVFAENACNRALKGGGASTAYVQFTEDLPRIHNRSRDDDIGGKDFRRDEKVFKKYLSHPKYAYLGKKDHATSAESEKLARLEQTLVATETKISNASSGAAKASKNELAGMKQDAQEFRRRIADLKKKIGEREAADQRLQSNAYDWSKHPGKVSVPLIPAKQQQRIDSESQHPTERPDESGQTPEARRAAARRNNLPSFKEGCTTDLTLFWSDAMSDQDKLSADDVAQRAVTQRAFGSVDMFTEKMIEFARFRATTPEKDWETKYQWISKKIPQCGRFSMADPAAFKLPLEAFNQKWGTNNTEAGPDENEVELPENASRSRKDPIALVMALRAKALFDTVIYTASRQKADELKGNPTELAKYHSEIRAAWLPKFVASGDSDVLSLPRCLVYENLLKISRQASMQDTIMRAKDFSLCLESAATSMLPANTTAKGTPILSADGCCGMRSEFTAMLILTVTIVDPRVSDEDIKEAREEAKARNASLERHRNDPVLTVVAGNSIGDTILVPPSMLNALMVNGDNIKK